MTPLVQKTILHAIAIIAICFGLCRSAQAVPPSQCVRTLGYQQITSLASAVGFTTAPAGASYAVITVGTAAIRWRDDGTDPTATVGMPVAAGQSFSYITAFSKIKFIQQTAGAILDIYFCQ